MNTLILVGVVYLLGLFTPEIKKGINRLWKKYSEVRVVGEYTDKGVKSI